MGSAARRKREADESPAAQTGPGGSALAAPTYVQTERSTFPISCTGFGNGLYFPHLKANRVSKVSLKNDAPPLYPFSVSKGCATVSTSRIELAAPMLVPNSLRNCVLFIGIKNGDRFLPRATGFVVIVNEFDFEWGYLVTAEHVVSGLIAKGHEIYVRYNRKEGGTVVSGPISSQFWHYHPTSDSEPTDVAVAPFRVRDDELIAHLEISGKHSIVCTPEIIEQHGIGHGEDVTIVGLFRTHHGQEKIIPVVRTGHIAAMREEPILTKYCGYVDAYLVEAQSIAGLSGSPVFVQMAPWRIVGSEIRRISSQQFYLLGLMHGHFDVANLNEDVVTDADGQSLGSINAGLGVVIPAEKIVETIFQPDMVAMREENASKSRDREGTTPDVVSNDTPPDRSDS